MQCFSIKNKLLRKLSTMTLYPQKKWSRIGLQECKAAVCWPSFLKTSQESREWLISSTQYHRVLISSPTQHSHMERETNPSREQKNAAVFANRISWRKITITSLTTVTVVERNNCTSRKKKIVTLNVIKRFCMQARNRPETF